MRPGARAAMSAYLEHPRETFLSDPELAGLRLSDPRAVHLASELRRGSRGRPGDGDEGESCAGEKDQAPARHAGPRRDARHCDGGQAAHAGEQEHTDRPPV